MDIRSPKIEAEHETRAVVSCCFGGAKMARSNIALALMLGVTLFTPVLEGLATPPPPIPERDVAVEFVRVLPPGRAHESGAIHLERLEPAVQKTIKASVAAPEGHMYRVLRKQTIHLGDPQLVHTSVGHMFEFRRVGELVECAIVDDGIVTMWSDVSPEQAWAHGFLCTTHRQNSDVYAVAWLQKKQSAPTPLAGQSSK
jgi:hypothetical protein